MDNFARGVWALTNKAKKDSVIDAQRSIRVARASTPNTYWQMSPDGFERLTQRLLRESGFVHVEVTGRTGDGGIDGRGIARVNGLMSFHVAFQCKKYKGAVSASEIRDFRGATVGRADRGLFITTGSFTKFAIEEANRDGASPIDLVDGDQLVSKLKELSLGVKTEMIEEVTVDSEWFISL
ncbi:restriction endonuclease [Paenalcaligenes hominis]